MDDLIIRVVCHFNPDRDLMAVVPTDVIDVGSAFVNGLIPENVVTPDSEYDNNDEPASIFGRPVNEFDAIHMSETLKKASETSNETKSSGGTKTEVE